jgi:cellulose synthase/poly-beta-1,6-N-acetylglucosamine synthase-like glycosyltransferase
MLAIALFVILLLAVLVIHLSYPVILRRLSKKDIGQLGKIWNETDSFDNLPMVSILIPVYNEELSIKSRIENILESKYPRNKLEIIVIDSGSDDKTRLIVESYFAGVVALITEKLRRGKASAINLGLQACKGDIIILTDGTTLYDGQTILNLVNSFKDSKIGAVSGFYDVPNKDESHVTASEHKFWMLKDVIRKLESQVHSTSWLSGEGCAVRKGIICKVDENTLADDSNIALQVISKGYKAIVTEKAHFTERSPTEFSDYIRVKSRRALGGLIETLRFKSMLFNSKYGYFGTVIFPYRFFVCVLSPILSCLLIGLTVPTVVELVSLIGFLVTSLIVFGLMSILVLFKRFLSTFFYTQLITIIALFWLACGKTDVRWTRSKTR